MTEETKDQIIQRLMDHNAAMKQELSDLHQKLHELTQGIAKLTSRNFWQS